MVGKDPHRIQGKTKDQEHMTHVSAAHDLPRQHPSDKERMETDRRLKDQRGGPSRVPADEQVGGSRPGVESRVKEALDRQQDKKG